MLFRTSISCHLDRTVRSKTWNNCDEGAEAFAEARDRLLGSDVGRDAAGESAHQGKPGQKLLLSLWRGEARLGRLRKALGVFGAWVGLDNARCLKGAGNGFFNFCGGLFNCGLAGRFASQDVGHWKQTAGFRRSAHVFHWWQNPQDAASGQTMWWQGGKPRLPALPCLGSWLPMFLHTSVK